MASCNTTLEDAHIVEEQLIGAFTFHHLSLVVSTSTGLASIVISLTLMTLHARYYSTPWQQRHVVRILFVVPVYSIMSFLAFLFYRKAVYYELAWNIYEAFVIASFFTLSNSYLGSIWREQKELFVTFSPKAWPWPLSWIKPCIGGEKGILKTPTNGLLWINTLWIGVFQYCFFKVLLAIAAVITQIFGRYCEASMNYAFAHVWILIIEALSVTVAKYCLLSHWHSTKSLLKEAHPHAKLQLVCIMLVVYLTFWQNLVWSILTSDTVVGVVAPTKHLAYQDIKVIVPVVALNVEMMVYSIMHLWAYSCKSYKNRMTKIGLISPYLGYWRAVWDICNPWDILKAIGRSARLLYIGPAVWGKKREEPLVPDGDSQLELVALKYAPSGRVHEYAKDESPQRS